jgi:hypothetical protein
LHYTPVPSGSKTEEIVHGYDGLKQHDMNLSSSSILGLQLVRPIYSPKQSCRATQLTLVHCDCRRRLCAIVRGWYQLLYRLSAFLSAPRFYASCRVLCLLPGSMLTSNSLPTSAPLLLASGPAQAPFFLRRRQPAGESRRGMKSRFKVVEAFSWP